MTGVNTIEGIKTPTIFSDAKRSDELLEIVSHYPRQLIMTHNNPDPDGIATGWALTHLLRAKLHLEVPFVAGGEIVRAENREMIRLLRPPLELTQKPRYTADTLIILVDCSVEAANHPRIDPKAQPAAVIDHHLTTVTFNPELAFQDIRSNIAATASIVSLYLQEQNIEPPEDLATALLYALKTETKGGQSRFSNLDRSILTWVTRWANPTLLAQIEYAPLTAGYFSDWLRVLERTEVFGDSAFCLLPQCEGPEIVGELADLLIRREGIQSILCGAHYRGNLIFSVRTKPGSGKNAAQIVLNTIEGLGFGGGHEWRAGGIILTVDPAEGAQKVRDDLKQRWLQAAGGASQPAIPLVTKPSVSP